MYRRNPRAHHAALDAANQIATSDSKSLTRIRVALRLHAIANDVEENRVRARLYLVQYPKSMTQRFLGRCVRSRPAARGFSTLALARRSRRRSLASASLDHKSCTVKRESHRRHSVIGVESHARGARNIAAEVRSSLSQRTVSQLIAGPNHRLPVRQRFRWTWQERSWQHVQLRRRRHPTTGDCESPIRFLHLPLGSLERLDEHVRGSALSS